jgi:hypothetical protein
LLKAEAKAVVETIQAGVSWLNSLRQKYQLFKIWMEPKLLFDVFLWQYGNHLLPEV